MLKIKSIPDVFMLRNKWHDMIESEMKVKNLPFRFRLGEQLAEPCGKSPAWFATDDEKKKVTIIVTETVLKYLSGISVPDCNVGMYFKDYLPVENSLVMLQCKDKIVPAKAIFYCRMASVGGAEYLMADIALRNVMTDDMYEIPVKKNDMWKFIATSDMIDNALKKVKTEKTLDKQAEEMSAYMSEPERMYQDTIIHKTIVEHIMNRLSNFLEKTAGSGSLALGYQNADEMLEDAKRLRENAHIHDNSKLTNKTEFWALTGIIDDKSCLRDASAVLSTYKQDAIELHWKNNTHHPEHYDKPEDMPRLARLEFVCDCCSRSLQYGTDLLDFMRTRQEQRFRFPEDMFNEIMMYCEAVLAL